MKTTVSIMGIMLAAALGGCDHDSSKSANTPNTGRDSSRAQVAGLNCPLGRLQSVEAVVADIPGGVAVAFSSSPDEVASLQRNVHALSDANDQRGDAFAACPCGVSKRALGAAENMAKDSPTDQGSKLGGPAETGGRPVGEMPAANSKVEETSTGAVLELKAKDETQVASLRGVTRVHTRAMWGTCPREGIQIPGQ